MPKKESCLPSTELELKTYMQCTLYSWYDTKLSDKPTKGVGTQSYTPKDSLGVNPLERVVADSVLFSDLKTSFLPG